MNELYLLHLRLPGLAAEQQRQAAAVVRPVDPNDDAELWSSTIDPSSGQMYWYNQRTKKTMWTTPACRQSVVAVPAASGSGAPAAGASAAGAATWRGGGVTAATVVAAVDPNDVAENWLVFKRASQPYFYNQATKKTTWDMPACLKAAAAAPTKSGGAAPKAASATKTAQSAAPNPDTNANNDATKWVERFDKKSGRSYWGNKVTRRTSWRKPNCVENAERQRSHLWEVDSELAIQALSATPSDAKHGRWSPTLHHRVMRSLFTRSFRLANRCVGKTKGAPHLKAMSEVANSGNVMRSVLRFAVPYCSPTEGEVGSVAVACEAVLGTATVAMWLNRGVNPNRCARSSITAACIALSLSLSLASLPHPTLCFDSHSPNRPLFLRSFEVSIAPRRY